MRRTRFDGSVAVVTGSSRGLGFAVARQPAERGAEVVTVAGDLTAEDTAAPDQGANTAVDRGDQTAGRLDSRLVSALTTLDDKAARRLGNAKAENSV
ncbi:hypothetical protein [Actinospica robiniae]|uniref:hypothetical protein n=1 Tax=Actinospica robiniae TaxID=304901 RepID=UPI000413ABE4|nr:hypothetical protein [Actinospica robiniae]